MLQSVHLINPINFIIKLDTDNVPCFALFERRPGAACVLSRCTMCFSSAKIQRKFEHNIPLLSFAKKMVGKGGGGLLILFSKTSNKIPLTIGP